MPLEYRQTDPPATTCHELIVPCALPKSVELRLKRLIDVIGSLSLLVVLSPALPLIALLIKLTSPGPVFHIQIQIGLNQRPFKMWKFRTMIVDAHKQEADLRKLHQDQGPFFKVKDDPRITPLGRVMRKYSVDELPQLINVLKGDMSLVGPRPLFDFEVKQFTQPKDFQRFHMRPGLTCIWQVSGRSNTSPEDRMRYDLEYVARWSLGRDFIILLKTIPVVLKGNGAV